MKKGTIFLTLIFVFIFSFGAIPAPKIKIDLDLSEEIIKEKNSEYPRKTEENTIFTHPPDCASYFTKNKNGNLLWLIFFPEESELAFAPQYGWISPEKKIFQSGMAIRKELSDGFWVYLIEINLEIIPADEFTVFFSYPSWNLGREETIEFKITKQ